MRIVVPVAVACSVALVLLAGCTRPATQLLAVVETDADASTYSCVRVEALRVPVGTMPVGGSVGLRTPEQITLPFSTGIVPPDGDPRLRVEVVAELRTDDCAERTATEVAPRIRRVVRTGFLDAETLRLPIFLADRCRDVACGADETCDPSSGTCTPILDVDPGTLAPVRPGDELSDAGATGPACTTTGEEIISSLNGPILSFGLAQSADGSRGVRSMTTATSAFGAELIGDLAGSPFIGSAFTGPTSIALLEDGSTGVFTLHSATTGLTTRVFTRGASGPATTIGGRCDSSRCVADFGADFAVLEDGPPMILHQLTTAGVLRAGTAVGPGATSGGVRRTTVGVLVSYVIGTICHLEQWTNIGGPSMTLEVPDCGSLDMAELADGRFAVAWIATDLAVHAGVSGSALGTLSGDQTLDATQSSLERVEIDVTASGHRVTWVDDATPPMLRSVRFDASGATAATECVAVGGHSLDEYRMFHAVRRLSTSAIEWPHSDVVFGHTFAD